MDRKSDISRAQQHRDDAGLVGGCTVKVFRLIVRALGGYSRDLCPDVIDTKQLRLVIGKGPSSVGGGGGIS